jgi:hypothetical protein
VVRLSTKALVQLCSRLRGYVSGCEVYPKPESPADGAIARSKRLFPAYKGRYSDEYVVWEPDGCPATGT